MEQYEKWLIMMMMVQKKTTNISLLEIFDHPYMILITGGFWSSGKTDVLLNLIKLQGDDNYSISDKIYLFVNNPYEVKYQYLYKKREKNGLENLKIQRLLLNIQIMCRMPIKYWRVQTR